MTYRYPYRSIRVRAALAVLIALGVPQARAAFETPIAIVDVRIVAGEGTTIESGTILLRDGRIDAVGADVDVPTDAERVDGAGLTAYPGFIDAQTHLGIPKTVRTSDQRRLTEDRNPDPKQGPIPMTRAANRRGVRPQWRAIEAYIPEEKKLETHRIAGFTAALIAPRDGIFAGTSDLIDLSGEPIRRSVLASRVAAHASFTIGEEGAYPRTLLGIFAQFRQVFLDARHYVKLRKYAERHPQTGPRIVTDAALEALKPLLAGTQRVIFEANSEREIHRALDLAQELKLSVVISGAKEAWKVVDRLKAERVPLIVSLKFDPEPDYGKKPDNKPGKTDKAETLSTHQDEKKERKVYEPLRLRKERRRLWEEQVRNVIRLHEAGIPFALRTRDFEKPGKLLDNLRMVIERGLPEDEAVTALTSAPAALLRVDRQVGTIARHRLANLTLMTGSIANDDAKVKYVFIGGRKFENRGQSEEEEPKDKPATARGGAEDSTKEHTDDAPSALEGEPTWAVELEADRRPRTRTGGTVLIQNATILPITAPTIERGSILIRDGKIEAMGTNVIPPEGVIVIDATGRFIIPGFVDAHSHLGLDAVNEGPLAISAEVRIADVINPTSVAIYRAVAGGTTTHHALHGSVNPIGGQNAILKLKYGRSAREMLMADAPRTIKFATGENVKQSNWASAWGKRFPNTRMGVEAVYRSALQAARAYEEERQAYRRRSQAGEDLPPLRRDLRLEALGLVLDGTLTVHAHCYRSEEILRLLGVAEEYGFRIGTLQHVLEGYRIAPELARHGCGASTFANFWAYKIEAFGAIPYNAAMLSRHGVLTSVNSDSPNTIRYMGQEAAKSIRWGGLGELDSLRLVTLNPALQLQIADRVGSLEVGKDGDLAIFNGHPLNTFSKCVMTLIEGEVYFEDARPEPVANCSAVHVPANVDRRIPDTVHHVYAITHATVHPISSPPIADATVVIVDDRIHAVGVDAPIPPGAGVIDATGLHVYPGLIDMGGTIGLSEIDSLRATQDFAEISTLSPHLTALSAVHPHSAHVRIARMGGTTTALTKPSGGRISGQSAVIHLDGWTAPEMTVLDTFALHMTVPSLPVHLSHDKKQKKKQKEGHDKAMRELEDFLAKAKHYAKVKALSKDDAKIEFEKDLTLEAMVPYVRGEQPVIFQVNHYKHILDTLEFAADHDLLCIISGATEAWKLADELAKRDVAVILGTPLSYPSGKFEPWDSVYRCAAELHRAGVRFCFASESAADAYNLGTQVGMAVAHGLPAEAAERALTLGAAEILGIADRVGSIEVGKHADLIVTTDTPLQTASVVTHMFIDGTPVELTSIHTEAYEKFKNRPEPILPPIKDLRGPPSLTGR